MVSLRCKVEHLLLHMYFIHVVMWYYVTFGADVPSVVIQKSDATPKYLVNWVFIVWQRYILYLYTRGKFEIQVSQRGNAWWTTRRPTAAFIWNLVKNYLRSIDLSHLKKYQIDNKGLQTAAANYHAIHSRQLLDCTLLGRYPSTKNRFLF